MNVRCKCEMELLWVLLASEADSLGGGEGLRILYFDALFRDLEKVLGNYGVDVYIISYDLKI